LERGVICLKKEGKHPPGVWYFPTIELMAKQL